MVYTPVPLVWSGFADRHPGRDRITIPVSDSREYYDIELDREAALRLRGELDAALADPGDGGPPVFRGNTRSAAQLAQELTVRGLTVADACGNPSNLSVMVLITAPGAVARPGHLLSLLLPVGGCWSWAVYQAPDCPIPFIADVLPVAPTAYLDTVADAVVELLAQTTSEVSEVTACPARTEVK